MRTRFICPFCREAVAEFDSGYDPETVEALLALHLEAWHPIRRRLSRRVRTALREIVPHTHSFPLSTGICECGAEHPTLGPPADNPMRTRR